MKQLFLILVCLILSGSAVAQDNTKTQMMFDKIERLEHDLILLQQRVYRTPSSSGIPLMGSTPAQPVSTGNPGVDELYSKLAAQEAVLAYLTAQLEKINFEMTLMNDRLNKINADVDMRSQTLNQKTEKTTTTTPASASKKQTAKEQYDAAYDLLKRGKYEAAEAQFQDFLKKYPKDKLAGNANYWLGETYYARGQMEQAAGIFAAGFTTYKDNSKAPDNLFKLGLTMKQLGKKEEACTAFANLAEAFPKADKTVKERAKEEVKKLSCPN